MNPRPKDASQRASRLTRREFVQVSATAATAGALWPAPWAHAEGSDTIRLGLIGCGGRGTGAASQALNADPGVTLVAMADVFEDRLAASHHRLTEHAPQRVRVDPESRFVGFDAYREVIERADVVILATPPHFRPAHLKAAVDAGTHVFCEKPVAVDAPGVRSVLETTDEARKKNLSIVSGFCWRYSAPERATYARIHDGAIGDIVSMHTTYLASPLNTYPRKSGWSDMAWQLRNWYHFRWLSGDHIVEQACHSVDKINWAMGGRLPVKATAVGGRLMHTGPERGNVYDHFSVTYEYEDGVRCFHTCRQMPNCDFDNTDYIMGTRGTCYINGWAPIQVINGDHPWAYAGEHPNMYQVEHDELFAAVRSDRPINDGVWMANSTMMSIMARMSAYTGRTITWEQAMNAEEDWTPPAYAMGDLDVPPVAKPGEYTIAYAES